MAYTCITEPTDDNRIHVTITVDATDVDAAVKNTIKDLAKKVRIPGFRAGKAPRSVIEAQLGRDYIYQNAVEAIVNDTYPPAIDEKGILAVGAPDFDDPTPLEEGQDYTYAMTVTPPPTATLKSTKIEIKMPPKEATEADIQAHLEGIQEQFGGFIPMAKTAKVKKNSLLFMSFTSTIDGEEYEGSTVQATRYQMGEKYMPDAFEEALIGHNAFDDVAIDFEVEPNGKNDEHVGKKMHFDVHIDAILKKDLPAIDDALATQVGYDTLDELKEACKGYITSQKEYSWDAVRDQRLLAALVQQMDEVEPLEQQVQLRAKHLLDDFMQMLKKNETDLNTYIEQSGEDRATFQRGLMLRAEKEVTEDMALDALARAENLLITDEELDEEFAQMAGKDDPETAGADTREAWASRGLITILKNDFSRRNALKWLRENATIDIDENETV
ncbi:MAG: trigger factor [Actinomycetes bacterium]|nr:trigger factor [Actinomycetes bacterium]